MRDGGEVEMPDVSDLGRLWSAWGDVGMTSEQGPLKWAELQAFGQIFGLTVDDLITLRGMSQAYLEGLALTSPLAIEPIDGA